MPKMEFISLLLFLSLFNTLSGSTVQVLTLHDSSSQTLYQTDENVAIYVNRNHLNEVSNNVLNAEKWLKTHVLTHYPSRKITTIVVGHNVVCNKTLSHVASSILPAMENLYHSLTRWGLQSKIEVSPSFSSDCFDLNANYSLKLIKPILSFLQNTNYSYSIDPNPAENAIFSVLSHTEWVNKMGVFELGKINLLEFSSKYSKPMKSRRLSSMGIDPFPPRPTPISPTHSPVIGPHVSLPPLVGTGIFSPRPSVGHAVPPYHGIPDLPPCNPNPSPSFSPIAPSPGRMIGEMWCVAKPSVPAETLQEAMDYACGAGGADCEAIGPSGSCYYPDTVVAHASYAFNSYWQKNKEKGGTCAFGGTAMLINADPSLMLDEPNFPTILKL